MPPEYIQFICKTCGRQFDATKYEVLRRAKVGKERQFCSRECAVLGREPGPVLEVTCHKCGKLFRRAQWRIQAELERGARHQFCSHACSLGAKARAPMDHFICAVCGKDFERASSYVRHARKLGREVKYCSPKCQHRAMAKANALRQPVRQCAYCGAPVQRCSSKLPEDRAVYCSKKCFGASCRNSLMLPCATCGKVHPVQPHRLSVYSRQFCSRRCASAATSTWTTASWGRQGKRADLGHRVRSSWEANVCRVIRALRIEYEYEPYTFLMNRESYTPDLRLADGTWIEIKGYAKPGTMQKLARFRNEFPNERLVLIDQPMYRAIAHEWGERIDGWER